MISSDDIVIKENENASELEILPSYHKKRKLHTNDDILPIHIKADKDEREDNVYYEKYNNFNIEDKIIKLLCNTIANDASEENMFDTTMKNPPNVNNLPYIFMILKSHLVVQNDYIYLHSIALIYKLQKVNPDIKLTKRTGVIIFLTAVCITNKFCMDIPFTSVSFDMLIDENKPIIGSKEILFLKYIDWNVCIDGVIIDKIYEQILKIDAN